MQFKYPFICLWECLLAINLGEEVQPGNFLSLLDFRHGARDPHSGVFHHSQRRGWIMHRRPLLAVAPSRAWSGWFKSAHSRGALCVSANNYLVNLYTLLRDLHWANSVMTGKMPPSSTYLSNKRKLIRPELALRRKKEKKKNLCQAQGWTVPSCHNGPGPLCIDVTVQR